MLTSQIHTIHEHEKIIPNRFEMAHVIIKRTRELIDGAPIKLDKTSELYPRRGNTAASHNAAKIALEELRTNKLTWRGPSHTEHAPIIPPSNPDEVIFTP